MQSNIETEVGLFIDGEWVQGRGRRQQDILSPSSARVVGQLTHALPGDLDDALQSSHMAFESWRQSSPIQRAQLLQQVRDLTIERAADIARRITLEQGKPFAEALAEVRNSADHAAWHAEECRRIYGRIIPSRLENVRQSVWYEPVGLCVAITPWNFPFGQAMRKICAAIGAGCTVVMKGPEDTPSAVVALAQLFHDAGLPPGCLNLVWGDPASVSEHLICADVTRKLSFTGSVPVGKHLAALAGRHMKRTTMELGGHAPAIVFDDVDVDAVASALAASKLRNAGQICVSPSRFYVHERIHDRFVERFADVLRSTRIGDGLDPNTGMGPLCHARRLQAMDLLVNDARAHRAEILLGGQRLEREGYFYPPTLVTSLPDDSLLMTQEPFGPIAPIASFRELDEVVARANSLPFGLAAYAFSTSSKRTHELSRRLSAGMVSVNHFGLALPETPFGGIRDSGHGCEGGRETFDAYLNMKFVTQMD